MSDLTKRLRASVRMDAINGDEMERSVCRKQMLEAADTIERLERERDEAQQAATEAADALEQLTPTDEDKAIARGILAQHPQATFANLLRRYVLQEKQP